MIPRMVGLWDFLYCWVYIGNYALIIINQINHQLLSMNHPGFNS